MLRIRIRDPGLGPFWPLDPGSGIGLFRIPDLGSRIPNSYFWELSHNFWGKKFHNSLKFGPNFFLQQFKNYIIFHFVKFVATKKCLTKNFFSPLSFLHVFGSGIRDPRSGIRDPGWVKIRIRDPGSGMGKNQDPGSGIRDKYPGSATLTTVYYLSI